MTRKDACLAHHAFHKGACEDGWLGSEGERGKAVSPNENQKKDAPWLKSREENSLSFKRPMP